MTSLRKIAASVAFVAVICGAAILWPVYKHKAAERKLAEAARVRADQGDAQAQYDLGVSYAQGRGVRRDHAEAVRWYRKAADQGYAKAQSKLASMYFYGKGVGQDYAESIRWARKAGEQGDAEAQIALASMYYYGKVVPRDYAEAVRWYRKAADQGDTAALIGLAYMYNHGQGVPQDHAEAFRWRRKAAERGDVEAQFYLGFSYFHGQGVPQDYAEAVRWYRKAADQNDRRAQVVLGNMYRKGQGVPRDYAEAVRWYGRFAASCLHWTSIVAILSGLAVFVVPRRRWGRATWLPWALFSAACAARLAHQLLLPEFSLAVLIGGQPGTMFWGYGRTVWIALLAGGSAMCALSAIGEVVRGSRRGGDQSLPPATQGTLESPA
jgi:TPR repeat protein